MTAPLLELDGVTRSYASGGPFTRRQFDAVHEVSFRLGEAGPEIFTVIGESGSGKTTLARMILKLEAPSRGAIRFRGADIAGVQGRRQRLAFMQHIQPVFQNPFSVFNPLKKVDRYLFSTARRFTEAGAGAELEARADQSLQHVGLSLTEVRHRYPHELSGGQLQRIAIARALIPQPALLIADEPVSMIDASLRMSIVNLFRKLRDELEVSIVYITHDLATAYYISDRIIIMQQGRIVEQGAARAVLSAPRHPYSRLLKDSVLSPDAAGRDRLSAVHVSEP